MMKFYYYYYYYYYVAWLLDFSFKILIRYGWYNKSRSKIVAANLRNTIFPCNQWEVVCLWSEGGLPFFFQYWVRTKLIFCFLINLAVPQTPPQGLSLHDRKTTMILFYFLKNLVIPRGYPPDTLWVSQDFFFLKKKM